jgi:uncharacterized protein
MRIELEKLEDLGGRFSRTYGIDELPFESELRLLEPVQVHAQARSKNGELELRGNLQTKVTFPCGRCLKPVELPIDVRFAERFVSAVSWRGEEQHELNAEDLDLAVFDGEAVELDDLVKEEILLAIPGHVLCGEDCKGLCPGCGVDRNRESCDCEAAQVDSRWDKLKGLQI